MASFPGQANAEHPVPPGAVPVSAALTLTPFRSSINRPPIAHVSRKAELGVVIALPITTEP